LALGITFIFYALDMVGKIVIELDWLRNISLFSLYEPGQIASGDANVLFRSEEHTSELQSRFDLVCRLLLEKKKTLNTNATTRYTSPRVIALTTDGMVSPSVATATTTKVIHTGVVRRLARRVDGVGTTVLAT